MPDCNTCEPTDFIYPLLADIFYPIVDQGAYGNVKKQWVLEKTIACSFATAGRKYQSDVVPNVNITLENVLIGRTRNDVRFTDANEPKSITNIIISNIRDANGNQIYMEAAGPRSGRPTLFEISTSDPIVGPFGSVEYYKLIITRSENQVADL